MSDYCMHVFLGPLRLLVVALSVRSIMLHSCKLCPTKSRFILSVVNVSCSLTVNQIFSCEDAAQQVLMYVRVCVRGQS